MICVALSTMKLAEVFAKVTELAPVKLVPVSTTEVPSGPAPGEKPLMVGGGITVKLPTDVATPSEL